MIAAAVVLLVILLTYYAHCLTARDPQPVADTAADDTGRDDPDWWAW